MIFVSRFEYIFLRRFYFRAHILKYRFFMGNGYFLIIYLSIIIKDFFFIAFFGLFQYRNRFIIETFSFL